MHEFSAKMECYYELAENYCCLMTLWCYQGYVDLAILVTFEILEVHPGDKYKYICISEIFFYGEGGYY